MKICNDGFDLTDAGLPFFLLLLILQIECELMDKKEPDKINKWVA